MNSSNDNHTNTCSGSLDMASSVILTAMNIISGILSVGGNALVLLAIARTPRLRKFSNFYVGSLAAADFSVGLIINPVWAVKSALNIWKNQEPLTQAAEFLSMQTVCATTLSLCAVSLDRYLAIAHVYLYNQHMTSSRCFLSIALIWLTSFVVPLPRLFITDPLDLPKLWITVSVIGFCVPFNIIAFCYFRIYKIARLHSRKIQTQNNLSIEATGAKKKRMQERKTACTIAIVIGIFVIFSSPSMILASIQTFTSSECFKHELIRYWSWAVFVAFACSACNPWVYAIRSLEYRSSFYRILGLSRKAQEIETNGTFNNTQD